MKENEKEKTFNERNEDNEKRGIERTIFLRTIITL